MTFSKSVRGLLTTICGLSIALACAPGAPRSLDAAEDFEERVQKSIDNGVKTLRSQLSDFFRIPPGDYPMGRIALCTAAILEAQVPTSDKAVDKAFRMLEDLPLEKTYSVACYLLALDAFWQQKQREESRSLQSELHGGPDQSGVAQGVIRKKMTRLVKWLVNARIPDKGVWSYESRPTRGLYDHSNTHFAILGIGVGLKNDIKVPPAVLSQITLHLHQARRTDGSSFRLELTPTSRFTPVTTPGKSEPSVVNVTPGGWPYEGTGVPTPSMTAAGASNLLIVMDGLQRLGKQRSGLTKKAKRVLYSALAWMSEHMNEYLASDSLNWYTLYSLEKVGDLGGIEKFNGRDWFREGCETLMKNQRRDGSWRNHVDTAFAVLFMTRATRPYNDLYEAPTIVTGPGSGRKGVEGQVYVDSLSGFISARQFLYYFAKKRDHDTQAIAEQVVRNYSQNEKGDLVPLLVMTWGNHHDDAAQFARRAIESITGVKGKKREFYLKWHRDEQEVRAFYGSNEKKDAASVGQLLNRCDGLVLKTRLLDYIERESLTDTSLDLVQELLVNDLEYRQRVHTLLERYTSISVAPPETNSSGKWKRTHAQWSEWVNGTTGRVLFRRARLERLVAQLNRRDQSREEASRQLEELLQFGREAVPHILSALKAGDFRTELILGLERLSGEYHGLDLKAWETWANNQ